MKDLRKEIEKTDEKIVELFERRMKTVSKIAQQKDKNNISILDSDREDRVIAKNIDYLKDKNLEEYLKEFYIKLMDISKDYQKSNIKDEDQDSKDDRDSSNGKTLNASNINNISGSTGLLCIIGNPIDGSQSPHMHNLSFKNLDLDYSYMGFNIEKGYLKEAIDAMRVLKVKGFNVTMPYKQEVMEYLDEIKTSAKLIGSVNTVLNDNGKLIGYNTDGEGFVKSLDKRKIEYKDKKIVILGAGGAARSVSIEFALKGAREIVIINRTLEKAEKIANIISENINKDMAKAYKLDNDVLKRELKDASVVVNTTSLGMGDVDESPINDKDVFHKDLFVGDAIYHPAKTKFLSLAEEAGCEIMNGLDMLIYQGDIAFKIWTGLNMPKDTINTMRRDFVEASKD